MGKRVLIIDNQENDYKIIAKNLGNTFEVFPAPADFIRITDYVRIFLNEQYGKERTTIARKRLIQYIKDNKIDFLIVDYKLSGTTGGGTGADLILELKGPNAFPDMPYIFLTRISFDTVKDKIKDVKNPEWVDKGFGGLRMADKSYFKEYIIKKITEMFGKSKYDLFLEGLDFLLDLDLGDSCDEKLRLMKNNSIEPSSVTQELMDLISECCVPKTQPHTIRKKINDFKYD